ncbi:MAG: sulfate reduction electron transfer complex DsrMKJOP subunit DsrJ [Planctomycetota bacterium]
MSDAPLNEKQDLFDKRKVLTGLGIFLVLMLFPIWYSAAAGKISVIPQPKVDDSRGHCVAPRETIRVSHMELLNEWRDAVVREGERFFVTEDNRRFERSLTRTCIGCHTDRKEFCDQCHDYVSVRPNCFDCHHERTGE